jgi:secretion/DNA translocation related TadE-like protein
VSVERGSTTVAMTGAVAIVALLSISVAGLGALYAARTQAQLAADAASLAAAVATYPPASDQSPEAAASDVAGRNGAVVTRCRCTRDASLSVRTVEVVTGVRVDVPVFGELTVRGSSRAEFDPGRWLGR